MESSHLCLNCNNVILNPLCDNCRTREIALWLGNHGFSPKFVSYVIRNIRKDAFFAGGDVLCGNCGEQFVSECADCYFENVKKILYFHFPQDVADKLIGNLHYKGK